MNIQEKIEIVNKRLKELNSVWVVDDSFWGGGSSLPAFLLEKNLISELEKSKFMSIGKNTNFFKNKYHNESLNSHSILYLNLLYNILFKNKL